MRTCLNDLHARIPLMPLYKTLTCTERTNGILSSNTSSFLFNPQFQPVLSILQVMIVLMNVQIIAIPVTVRQDVPLVNKVTMAADVQRIVYTKHVIQI